jgi:hypothetical protein
MTLADGTCWSWFSFWIGVVACLPVLLLVAIVVGAIVEWTHAT